MFSYFERLIDPYPGGPPTQPPAKLGAFFWHYTKHAWPVFLVMSVLVIVLSLAELVLFSFLGNIIDWLSQADRKTFLAKEGWKLTAMVAVALIVIPILSLAHSLLLNQGIYGNFAMSIRWQMHRFLLRQSMAFYTGEFAGRVAARVMQASLAIRDAVVTFLSVMMYVGVYFLGSLILVASFHWMLALPFFVWLACYGVILRIFLPKMAHVSKRQADARSLMTGRVVDSYTNITTVKLFAHTDWEEEYARQSMDSFLETVQPKMRLSTRFEVCIQLLNGAFVTAAGGVGIWLWLQEFTGVGAVAVAIGLSLRMHGMAHWIMWELARVFESIGVAQDGMNMLSIPVIVKDRPGATELEAAGQPITFQNIRFAYGKEGRVIDKLLLEISPGEKIGLVGRSGAGKTTLTNILLRFYELEAGAVMIGEQNIRDVTQDSLRRNIGVVTQDTSLLHRSIRENIAYSKPDAEEADIIDAARKANAWEFIETLTDNDGNAGLDAQVGERGVKLSGGQRQRIAIARIFLKDAPVLVLDEATSALDSEVEAAIQENLFELMKGKTVIAIAHRLSTIAQMDRLIVMDDGEIVEAGTHEELAKASGIYSQLWARQSGGFIQ